MLPPHRPVAATRLARAHTAHNIPQIYEEIPRNETKGPDLPRNRRAVAPRRGDFPAFFWNLPKTFYFCLRMKGGLAQLARALAWHARGHEFESRILHDASGQAVSIRGQPVLHTKARHSRTAGRLSRSEPANPDYRRGGIPLRERTERDSPRGLAGISARRNTPENHERIEDRWKIPPYRPTSRGCSASRSTNWSGSPPRTGCPGSPRGRSPRGFTAKEPIRSAG